MAYLDLSPPQQHTLLRQLQQLSLRSSDSQRDSRSGPSQSNIPQQAHEVLKVCFTYLHPVTVARVMASSKGLSALCSQQLRMGHARHAARQLLLAAVQGAAVTNKEQQKDSTNQSEQARCEPSQQQCAQAVTWLLKAAGPELVAAAACSTCSSSSTRCQLIYALNQYEQQASVPADSLNDESGFITLLLSIPEVPLAVTAQLAAAGLQVSYSQAVAAARAGVPGVHTWLEAQLLCGVSLDALGLPAHFRDAAVLQRRLEQRQVSACQVRRSEFAVNLGRV